MGSIWVLFPLGELTSREVYLYMQGAASVGALCYTGQLAKQLPLLYCHIVSFSPVRQPWTFDRPADRHTGGISGVHLVMPVSSDYHRQSTRPISEGNNEASEAPGRSTLIISSNESTAANASHI